MAIVWGVPNFRIFTVLEFLIRKARNQEAPICIYRKSSKIGTKRSKQTEQTLIRLLAKGAVWSGSTLFAIPSASLRCTVKPNCSILRAAVVIISGDPMFSFFYILCGCIGSNLPAIKCTIRHKYAIHAIPHTMRQNLTEFRPSESQISEEFSNFTEFLDKFIRNFVKKYT